LTGEATAADVRAAAAAGSESDRRNHLCGAALWLGELVSEIWTGRHRVRRPGRLRHATHQGDVSGLGRRGDRGQEAIIGVLARYLDFINLFLMQLQLFGQRRQD
jgi:hypothetical protein